MLYIHKRFHQAFQNDKILIFDISSKKRSSLRRLDELKRSPLVGGWEDLFLTSLQQDDGQCKFLGNEFSVKERKEGHNRYVSDRRSIDAVRGEVI